MDGQQHRWGPTVGYVREDGRRAYTLVVTRECEACHVKLVAEAPFHRVSAHDWVFGPEPPLLAELRARLDRHADDQLCLVPSAGITIVRLGAAA